MHGTVIFYCEENKKVIRKTQRFENVDILSFQEKKKYFFEKNYKGKKYKIIGNRHFRYTGKTMEVEQKVEQKV